MAPGANMIREHLYNACANNANGFGLILKDAGKIQIIRKFKEDGNDPDEIIKLINDNIDVERILHVRHSTKGATNEENTQPFCSYHSDRRQVWFAHNGTLHNFGPTYVQGTQNGKSDTLDFNEKILTPALAHWHGEHGNADYTDPDFWKLVLEKHWSMSSKGILVSNDLPVLRFGTGWMPYKHTEGESSGEIFVSNTEYFDKLTRGPIFQKLEDQRRKKLQEETAKRQAEMRSNSPQKGDRDEGYPFEEDYYPPSGQHSDGLKVWSNNNARSDKVIKAFNDVADTWDFSDPEEVAMLSFITFEEWKQIVHKYDILVIAVLLQSMAEIIYELIMTEVPALEEKIEKLEGKLERSTQKIASMKAQSNVREAA